MPTTYVVCLGVCDSLVLAHYKRFGPRESIGLNGPGGKIRDGETPAECAAREWAEEVVGAGDNYDSLWVPVLYINPVHFMAARVEHAGLTQLIDGYPATMIDPFAPPKCGHSDYFIRAARIAVNALAG